MAFICPCKPVSAAFLSRSAFHLSNLSRFSGALYQAFNGVEADDLSVTINVVDEKTNETFKSIKYPDALEN